jgi:hypothetical protein
MPTARMLRPNEAFTPIEEDLAMTPWTSTELDKIGKADELTIESQRKDGTLRKPVTIWVVRVGDELYIRSVNGRASGWFRGVLTRHAGRIRAGGVVKDVDFVEVSDPAAIAQVDAAYRSKYGHYPAQYVDPMVVPLSQAATIRLAPRP